MESKNNLLRNKEKDLKLKEILGDDVFNSLENSIKKIENSIPTTKNHYGDYMSLLSNFKDNKQQIAIILIYLGGNIEGIKSALNLL